MINVLLTSAGRRSYIVDYFKACKGIGKVYASNSKFTIALKRADGFFISPLIYEDNYIPSIIQFCKENDIKMVLSLFDIDLYVLAINEETFINNGIELVLAPAEFVRICNDKWETYNTMLKLGINTPKTFLNTHDVEDSIEREELKYPIIMKPRWGMASMDIFKICNNDELRVLSNKSKDDIFNSYLKYESSMTPNESIIYQEMLTGEEYGIDILNDLKGNYISVFAKEKISMRSGETDLGRTADSAVFESTAKKISSFSGHHGILSVDCFHTESGIYVIEMNCRISGHYPIAYLAGFNYPQLLVDWMNGKPTDPDNLKFKTDLLVIKDLIPTILGDNKVIKDIV